MKNKGTHGLIKLLSVFMAAFLLFNLLPNKDVFRVDAAPYSQLNIHLPDGIAGDIKVKLTDEMNPYYTQTASATNGTASFTYFADDQNTYKLDVTGMIGYEDYSVSSLLFDQADYSILSNDLKPMDRITVSGSLLDENGNPYAGNGTISYTGYETGTASFTDSAFSLSICKSQDYQLTIQTDGNKYKEINLGTINAAADQTLAASALQLNSYTVTATAHSNGTISPAKQDVLYGGTATVTAAANNGYRISRLLVDGNEESQAKDLKTYDYTFTDVKANHTISAEFTSKTYTVTKESTSNGRVNGDSNWKQFSVTADNSFTITAVPNNGYTLTKIEIDGVVIDEKDITFTNGKYEYTIPSVTKDCDVQVSFAKFTMLTGDPSLYYTMTYDAANFIKQYTEADVTTYVFKNNSAVTFAPIAPYDKIFINYESNNIASSIMYNASKKINYMNVVPVTDSKHSYGVPIKSIQIIIDNDAPQVAAITEPAWTSGSTIVSGTVSDLSSQEAPSSGLTKVVWSDCFLDAANVLAETKNCAAIAPDGSYSFTITGEQDKVYNVYAVDLAGNVSAPATVRVRIDATAPTIDSFAISKTDTSPAEKAVNYLSFGTFFNEQLLVAVTASDPLVSSGLKSITLYINDVPYQTSGSLVGSKAVFTIPSVLLDNPFVYDMKLSATATDSVGNVTNIPIALTAANSNAKSDSVMLESVKPIADIVPDTSVYTDSEGRLWYSENTGITVHASDLDSGIQSVSIKINNQAITADADGKPLVTDYSQEKIRDVSVKISTAEAVRNSADGSYLIEVTVVDNAGNSAAYSQTVYRDTDAPSITEFSFAPVGIQEADGKTVSAEAKDYGYYFTEDTTVTVSARDLAPTSGIASITYCTIDINGTKTEKTIQAVNDKISFVIPANFKGQIFAKAMDHVGNEPEKNVTPYSAIIENSSLHRQEQHIAFTKDATAQKDADNLDLYSKDTNVQVTVSDTCSGLRKVEWTVIAPNDTARNQSGTIEIGNDKLLTGDSAGWTEDQTDKNLVTKMSKTLTVSNNSNAIKVWVRITDRSGNVSEDILTFSIDKTAPTISIAFDNNAADGTYKDFYKANRTATVVITERNFNPADVAAQIANTESSVPTISSWTTQPNALDPDKTTHTATVVFGADGDYTFDVNYSDNAKNAAADYPVQAFTIDKTIPKVSVSYNNRDAQNGNYYKADRTATVTVIEHNFDASRIRIEGTASDNGKNVTFPSVGAWTSQGDVHTAQIQYAADAKYTFDISGIDKAGNSLADYPQEQFYVDKTAPVISITGVADKSANNGDVIPVISYTDTNFDKSSVAISLTGSNRGPVKAAGTTAAQSNGGICTFSNFEKTKENDDLYTLTATLVDLAGNKTTKTIVFSVNRFGSVYAFADSLKEIEGKYVQTPIDVVITETNVDSLKKDSIQLKMTYNGTPKDLVKGTDYTVEETGGSGEWSQYTYKVNQALFTGDGRYTVTLYSEDLAGNINENIDESKKAEISFGIDKTSPDIVSVDLDSNQQYAVTSKTATFAIKDNLVLKGVTIYLDGKEVKPAIDGENYTINIGSQNRKQVVKIVSVDAAGNQSTLEIDNFLVTTNLFYRWINNTMVFVLSLVGMGILITAIVVYFVFFRRKKPARREMHR